MSTFAKIWSKVWYNLFSYELQPRWEITNNTMDNVHNVHGYHGYTHTASQETLWYKVSKPEPIDAIWNN